jgi:hypothetical protein
MGFVDNQQPEPAGQLVEHPPAEPRVGQALRRDQQDVKLVSTQRGLNLGPGIHVGRVQGRGPQPGPACRDNLVAHQGQQR